MVSLVVILCCSVGLWMLPLARSQSSGRCDGGDIRLVGGDSYLEGRVEVCVREQWSTVCDDGWDEADANVACGQLGYSSQGAVAFLGPRNSNLVRQSPYGLGTGDISLEDLSCVGNESSLFECQRDTQCSHNEDAAVRCQSNERVVSLLHDNRMIPNNSLLSLDSLGDINGTSSSPIFCVTNLPDCCDTNRSGNWYPPDGNDPLSESSNNATGLSQFWTDDQSIQLMRPIGVDVMDTGLYRCEIPDRDNVTHTFYVGIYQDDGMDNGAISSVEMTYNRSTQTLTCISTGGPATSITWTLNGSDIVVDNDTYQTSQTITSTSTATYRHMLTLVAKSSALSGTYTCSVGNMRGNSSTSTNISVCRDGELLMANDGNTGEVCLEDEWLPLENFPAAASQDFPVSDLQLEQSGSEILLDWNEPPNNAAISYKVECSATTSPGVTLTSSRDVSGEGGPSFSTSLPLPEPQAVITHRCCVTTILQGSAGVRISSSNCRGVETTPTVDPFSPCPPTTACSYTLTLVLGVVAAIFLLLLLIFSIILVHFIYVARRSRKTSFETTDGRITEYEMKMDTLPRSLPATPPPAGGEPVVRKQSDPLISNPMYGSATNVEEMIVRPEERRKSNASQAAANPMYSTVNSDTRRSFIVRRGERVAGVHRSHSSAAAISRRTRPTSSEEVPPIPPYTAVVPKDMRNKQHSPSQSPEQPDVNAVYSDIDPVHKRASTRGRLPTPPKQEELQTAEQVGLRGREPSPMEPLDPETGGAIYSDIDQGRKATLKVSAAKQAEEQDGLRGKEPSPSPEQIAAEEANGGPPPLYSTLDQNQIQWTEPSTAVPQKVVDEIPSEPLYSSIDNPVTPPARNKALSVSQEPKPPPPARNKALSVSLEPKPSPPARNKAQSVSQDHKPNPASTVKEEAGDISVPGEDEYSTLKHL